MFVSIAVALSEPSCPAAQLAEDAQYYRGVLHELIDMGMGYARQVCQQAQPRGPTPDLGPAPDVSPDPGSIAFERIARAIRRSIALARAVAAPVAQPADHTTQQRTGQRRTAARARIIREVEDVIQRRSAGIEADGLHSELLDRLDAPELDDEIGDRPVADIIADICRDLGVAALPGTRPWKRRTPNDIMALCALAAAPSALSPHPSPSRATLPGWSGSDPPLGPDLLTGRHEAGGG